MPQSAILTGLFDQQTGAVNFELKVYWHDTTSGCRGEQTMTGYGFATSAEEAAGTAGFTITAVNGVGDSNYEPLGCYGDYGGTYWDGYTVTGTVPWVLQLTPILEVAP